MENMKKSNFLKSNPLFLIASIAIHGAVLFYPVQYIIQKNAMPTEEIVPGERVIKIQLTQVNPDTKFIKMEETSIESEDINHSNILSNKTVNSENELVQSKAVPEGFKPEGNDDSPSKLRKVNEALNKDGDVEITDISTVKFKYFDYYVQIKDDIESKWKNIIRDKFKNIKLEKEILLKTVLILKVNQSGLVENILIGEGSGSEEIDKIAMSIFKDYSMTPPPKEIFNNKEHIYLYWGFAIKL